MQEIAELFIRPYAEQYIFLEFVYKSVRFVKIHVMNLLHSVSHFIIHAHTAD